MKIKKLKNNNSPHAQVVGGIMFLTQLRSLALIEMNIHCSVCLRNFNRNSITFLGNKYKMFRCAFSQKILFPLHLRELCPF